MEIAVGNGCVLVGHVERDGRNGLLLEQTCEPHDHDMIPPDENGKKYVPENKDVVIWFDSIEGARALQDQVNKLVLFLTGHVIR